VTILEKRWDFRNMKAQETGLIVLGAIWVYCKARDAWILHDIRRRQPFKARD
jgi:hypothetical protein